MSDEPQIEYPLMHRAELRMTAEALGLLIGLTPGALIRDVSYDPQCDMYTFMLHGRERIVACGKVFQSIVIEGKIAHRILVPGYDLPLPSTWPHKCPLTDNPTVVAVRDWHASIDNSGETPDRWQCKSCGVIGGR